jgi:predicted dehydrogenase
MKRNRLRYGMVGGAKGAFIGDVHRKAIALEEKADFVAACFTTNESRNKLSGEYYGIEEQRLYKNYQDMAESEALREDKIDFICIVTPNVTHYEIAKAFLMSGIHVMCEKPLCFHVEQAEELEDIARERNLLFGVNYSYSGFAMVKFAKQLVQQGEIGDIINVNGEYLQEWLIDEIGGGEQNTVKLSGWRTSPDIAGISNCVGDIGTHIEHTVSYITGMQPKRISAVLDCFGHALDMNANMLVEFENGAHGVFSCSQVCAGHLNGLAVRIFGTKGAIEWEQEEPNSLKVTRKGQPVQIYHRGTGYIDGRAALLNHIPSGHPEGLLYAFANVYNAYLQAVLNVVNAEVLKNDDLDFPSISSGVFGVKFISSAVSSSKEDAKWKEIV